MKEFYVPEGIEEEYCYIVPANGYYDIYNTNYLSANGTYKYYRFYDSVDQDMYTENYRTIGYTSQTLNAIQVVPKHDYIYRKDYPQICSTVFILVIGFVFLINILTSIVRKGGVLSDLF